LHVQEAAGGQSGLYRQHGDVGLRIRLVDRVAVDAGRVDFIGRRIE
jgi:hypothetical protein